MMYYFYIIKNSEGQLYLGQSNNLNRRISDHNNSRGSKLTRDSRDNFELVYSEEFQTRKQAMDRERQVKKWSRAKKDALIKGDTGNLKKLARRKTLS